MSFFFNQQKAKAVNRRSPTGKPAQASKSSKETLNRLGCRVCPLDKAHNHTPKMEPIIADETDIYILGDMPSEECDDKGKPFSDKAGKILKNLLRDRSRISYGNMVRDYDHYKEQPQWVAMECCRGLTVKSIEQTKPKLVVGLGILPLQWALNSSDMVGLRGRIFAVKFGKHACWFMPTYHPSFIIESAYDNGDPLRSKLGHCLKFDLQKAAKAVKHLNPPEIDTPQAARGGIQTFNGRGAGQLAQVLKLISEARRAPEKAIDLETFPLRPYAKNAMLLSVAISYGNTNFSFAWNHPKAAWDTSQKKQLKEALIDLLMDETIIIAHNTPFEVEWLAFELGKEAIMHDVWECTMMQSHFIDERRGKRGGNDDQFQPNPYQALNFLIKQHFGVAYKAFFKLDRKDLSKADLDEVLLYNGADTKYTLKLYKHQTKLLKEAGLYDAYLEARPRQPTVALMQNLGILVDAVENKRLQKKLGTEVAAVEARITSREVVASFEHKEKHPFNPASQPDVLKIFKDYLKVGDKLLDDKGKSSVDKGALSKIDDPLAKDIEEFRNRSKLKSTYVDSFEYGKGAYVWPDRLIHPSFNTTFAETGRTSSDEPNQQNWPKRNDKYIRKQIIPLPGHVLVAFDFGQLEACTGAMCSKDKNFVKALWEDYDIHMEWALEAAYEYPALVGGKAAIKDKAVMGDFRGLIKNKLVFPAFFGAAKESITGYLRVATGVDVPQESVDKLFNKFWRTFNGVQNWQKRLVKDYYETGFVESPTGRRRHYPLTKSQAINYPIQSVACDIVCRAMVTLSEYAISTGNWYYHPIMNIHDDLTFSIPNQNGLLEEAIEKIYRVMLADVYPFINVPLSVECSIGNNWLEMDKIDKFWSHKL